MKRRDFIQASLVTGTVATLIPQVSDASVSKPMQPNATFEFYELRTYTVKNGRQRKLIEDYFQQAAIPALNKVGSKNIGVFTEYLPQGFTKLIVLIPYASLTDFMEVAQKLAKDTAYLQAAAPYLNATATEPAYERIESSLFKSFAQMPALEVPEKKPRLFELRRYESPSEVTGKKKIEMFNDAGEIAIFKRVGLTPVFFGEAVIGSHLPNLTYMLVFDNMEEHDQNWKKFGSDPEWKKISTRPEYSDEKILSGITRTFLVPTAFSQI
ncbi:NIPSNAP family protein [Xanthocytophaga flava]|uniref:NIPSNAP family protein n=1 Tax=Xanthocytophaga flava TaxID=3048013 RepID=UPI0028D8CAB7|nr:NIPSNAP family protein [Xanthocytophaga flavus]MDJ1473744.1 NIPSNAP family protein [Xanthocytophaga flavus]